MAKYKWVRKNLVSSGSPLYVYECEDAKVDYLYDEMNYDPENTLDIKTNLFRVVHKTDGWEVLIWEWDIVKGAMGYVRCGGSWGWKTKKEAIEDAEYEIENRYKWVLS